MQLATVLAALLFVLPLQPEPRAIPEYDRSEWGGRWMPTGQRGGEGCMWDTRHMILRRDAVSAETREERGKSCRVTGMVLIDPYTAVRVAGPAGDFDVDHVVPVAEAHRSGGWAWPADKKVAYYNDRAGLVATTAKQNRSKGDKDPGKWLPAAGRCEYARVWIEIKTRWGLTMDAAEVQGLAVALGECK